MPLLKELSEIVNPSHTALLVIDVQNDFCSITGAKYARGRNVSRVQKIMAPLNGLIQACRKADVPVVWVKEIISEDRLLPNFKAKHDLDKGIWFIKENTPGAEFCKELVSITYC